MIDSLVYDNNGFEGRIVAIKRVEGYGPGGNTSPFAWVFLVRTGDEFQEWSADHVSTKRPASLGPVLTTQEYVMRTGHLP